jgi:hypothetical protein
MRYISIGSYEVSVLFLLAVLVIIPIVCSASYYFFTSVTIPFTIEEPLSITNYSSSIHVHPGENKTLDIEIQNSAAVNYSITLIFGMNDTVFQNSYVTTSNLTYNIAPGVNQITAWIAVDTGAHPAHLELIIDFYRE